MGNPVRMRKVNTAQPTPRHPPAFHPIRGKTYTESMELSKNTETQRAKAEACMMFFS